MIPPPTPDPSLERWEEIEAALDVLLDSDPSRWPVLLDEVCGGDDGLRREVEELLRRHEPSRNFLRSPAPDLAAEVLGRDREAARSPSPEGHVVGAYRIVREIGRGGMGRVFLAERADGAFEQRVALKLLRSGLAEPDAERRFRAERQILASLEHPAIARLLDGGVTEEGLSWLAMEYVEGRPIDGYCQDRGLPVRRRLELFLTLASAVQYAHRNLVVHRDLKPSNIQITPDGQLKLLDFGIAKLLPEAGGDPTPLTRPGQRFLTPEYSAPEQVRGEPVTTATDVYQLGVVLYELLSGRRPFEGEGTSLHELERAILEREPEKPSTAVSGGAGKATRPTPGKGKAAREANGSEAGSVRAAAEAGGGRASPDRLRKTLAGDLDAIVLKALRKEPELRYASAAEMGEDVRRHLAGLPVLAHEPSPAYRLRKFAARHRWGLAAAAGLVLILTGFGSVYTVRITEERNRARLEAAKAAQVTGFLMGLFEANDPREARGDSVTARELLARGLEHVETLEAQPAVQAEMLDVLGRVYHSLAEYDRALPLLERAVAMRRELLGEEDLGVAESLNNVARVLRDKGDNRAAEPLFRKALAIRRTLLGEEHPDIAQSLNNLAMVLHNYGDLEDAEGLYREALAMRRELLGQEHPDVATSLNNLGQLFTDLGDYDRAEAFHREALAIRRRVLGDEHLDVTYSLNNLALVLHNRGDYVAAERLYRENLALERRLLGAEHPKVALTMNNLAALLRDRGDYAAAEPLFREVLAMRRKYLGDAHPQVAWSLHNLASLLVLEGEPAQAEPLLRDAIRISVAARGGSHWQTAYYKSGLGACLTGLGRYDEAEALLLDAHSVVGEELGGENRFTQRVLRRLVALYEAWGRPEQAARYDSLRPPRSVRAGP